MLRQDFIVEYVFVERYYDLIFHLGNKNTTTRRMLEGILAMEEEHADELVGLFDRV